MAETDLAISNFEPTFADRVRIKLSASAEATHSEIYFGEGATLRRIFRRRPKPMAKALGKPTAAEGLRKLRLAMPEILNLEPVTLAPASSANDL